MPTSQTLTHTLNSGPIAEARRLLAEAGSHFFDRESMRFFSSRVGSTCLGVDLDTEDRTTRGDYHRLIGFVSSEQYVNHMSGDRGPRLFTARVYELRPMLREDGRRVLAFDSWDGEFQAHRTSGKAWAEVRSILTRLSTEADIALADLVECAPVSGGDAFDEAGR